MFTVSLSLILVSAICHATWNILAKRANDKLTFLWLQMGFTLVILGIPIFLLCPLPPKNSWIFLLLSGVLQAVYYVLLSKVYSDGDLSIVYPLLRGTAPVYVAILSFFFGIDKLSLPMFISILIVLVGIYIINLPELKRSHIIAPFKLLVTEPSTRLALLVGIIIAFYTLVDRKAVSLASPFTVLYIITALPFVLLMPLMIKRGLYKTEIKLNKISILLVGILTFAAYVLVLIAMKLTAVSFISSFREVSVVFIVIYEMAQGKKVNYKSKLLGASIIFVGILLLSYFTFICT